MWCEGCWGKAFITEDTEDAEKNFRRTIKPDFETTAILLRMKKMAYVLALDQGTKSSRAILFDKQGNIAGVAQHEFPQIFPAAGWVEHDPLDILTSQLSAAVEVLGKAGANPHDVLALGITNQRETTIVWD